jgi:hypothetical protein
MWITLILALDKSKRGFFARASGDAPHVTVREGIMGINMISVEKEVLTDYGCRVLEAAGVPKDEAAFVTECLVDNDLKGYTTHGVSRIPWYVPGFQKGDIQVLKAIYRYSVGQGSRSRY